MLLSGRELRNTGIMATDGEIGQLQDIFFDDRTWRIRYLVIDTRKWLPGRRVLISPEAVIGSDDSAIRLNLTREQIRNSPDVSTDKPVSQQIEADLAGYYGWAYIPSGMSPAIGLAPPSLGLIPGASPEVPPVGVVPSQEPDGDPHLRSMKEIDGYRVFGPDGTIGRVSDFAIRTDEPKIQYLIVEADGSDLRVPPETVAEIEWTGSSIRVLASRGELVHS